MRQDFKFNMGDMLTITASGERGEVIATAAYATMENQYQIRYKAGDGRATEAWWGESALTLTPVDF